MEPDEVSKGMEEGNILMTHKEDFFFSFPHPGATFEDPWSGWNSARRFHGKTLKKQVQVVLSFCVDVYEGLVCCRFVVGLSCRVICNEKAGVEFVMHAGIFSISFIADA